MAHSNPITIGMLAHVDAGKTTLSEAILYSAGSIRKLGRVDNQDTFLDTGDMERARGITIFSKQAAYNYNGSSYTLLDTPGHVDFSAETERTLWVLDAAVLVISGMDGVQGHTETLWSLLKRLGIPVFIFVNKMDQQGTNRAGIMEQLKNRLSESCVDFNNIDYEEVAMCHEEALEQFLDSAHVDDALISDMVMNRRIFPVYFGSALRMNGVEELIKGIDTYAGCPEYSDEFSAKVYKITRDDRGERLTHLKVCGGSLKSKMLIGNEKVNQIRVYAGDKFTSINEAPAGTVCAATGLSETKAGQFIGAGGGRMKLLFRWINKLLCGWNVGLYFRPRIRYEGKKCLPAFTRGPAIIITNHKNQMDFLLVLYLFYFRYVRCLVGKTFYECNRFLNWCLRMLGAIKVDRFSFGMDFFCESVEALRRGQLLLIFPEGRFSTTGEILEFRSTAALLALQTDVPIIPMWHSVNYGFGKRTDVVIGEPIRLSELCSTANPDAAELDRLTAILRDKVIELRGMAQEA